MQNGTQNASQVSAARRMERRILAVTLAVLLAVAGVLTGARTVLAVGSDQASGAAATAVPQENATPKSEVVYANLAASGTVEGVYVVNVLDPQEPGTVTDFGSYTAVQNLTDAAAVTQEGDAVTVDVAGDTLSYQGDLGAAALPWTIAVSYALDGASVAASDLGGASGKLAIGITTTRNEAVDAAYFENYLLQVSVSLPQSAAHDVTAPDGQIAMAGSNTQVTFMAMPGKEGSFTLEAQVQDFQMPGISFAAVPLAMGFESPDTSDLISGFEQLGSGVGQLSSGAGSLATGAGELAGGAGQLSSGAAGVAEGASSLAGGVGQAASGAASLADGAAGIAAGLLQYQQGLQGQAAAARGMVDQSAADQAEDAYEAASGAYTAAFAEAYYQIRLANPSLSQTEAMGQAAIRTASQAQAMQDALAALVAANAANAGYSATASSLDGAAAGLDAADPSTGMSINAAVAALAQGIREYAAGADQLSSGASDLASGAGELAGGTAATAQGASSLAAGADELASGTETLYTEVQAMPAAVQEEIDKMMAEYDKSGFVPPSFTSPKNTNVTLVQFVLTTAPIEAPEAQAEEPAEPEESIVDRFFALFQ